MVGASLVCNDRVGKKMQTVWMQVGDARACEQRITIAFRLTIKSDGRRRRATLDQHRYVHTYGPAMVASNAATNAATNATTFGCSRARMLRSFE